MINWKTNAEKPEDCLHNTVIAVHEHHGRCAISNYESLDWRFVDRWCYLSELVADAMGERVAFSEEEIREKTLNPKSEEDRIRFHERMKLMRDFAQASIDVFEANSPITNTGPQDL